MAASDGPACISLVLSPAFASNLTRILRAALRSPKALPEDWDPRATTYDLTRFDSETQFAARLDAALARLVADASEAPPAIRAALEACGLPYDYARLGQPLSTVYELLLKARTGAARVVSFASVTKPWLSIVEAPGRTLPIWLFAEGKLPISAAFAAQLRERGVTLHEHHTGPIDARADANTVHVLAAPFSGDLRAQAADAVCHAVPNGGVLLLRDEARIDPAGVQLIRKRTVSALLATDALHALEREVGLEPTATPAATPAACDALLRRLFPEIVDSLYFCTGLAAAAAVFAAAADVLGPSPVTFFYAQNGYGGTGQLIAEVLAPHSALWPAPLPVLGTDADGRAVTLVGGVLACLETLAGAPAAVFLETPTNPELQAHDFYAMTETQVRSGLSCGLLSFYLPSAPTEHADLVDEFVEHLLAAAPALVKNRVSYGQSTGGGRPDWFYVINPQESTQGSLSDAVKNAQKRDNVQICRISVPEHADVAALLEAMEPFFTRKYGARG